MGDDLLSISQLNQKISLTTPIQTTRDLISYGIITPIF